MWHDEIRPCGGSVPSPAMWLRVGRPTHLLRTHWVCPWSRTHRSVDASSECLLPWTVAPRLTSARPNARPPCGRCYSSNTLETEQRGKQRRPGFFSFYFSSRENNQSQDSLFGHCIGIDSDTLGVGPRPPLQVMSMT